MHTSEIDKISVQYRLSRHDFYSTTLGSWWTLVPRFSASRSVGPSFRQ
jgi:hypothetical protein